MSTGEKQAEYNEALTELAAGIALGAVPFLGQAIDAYDTVESCIHLYNEKTAQGKEDAQFDLLMAIIGWIPGPGDGLKKSLRIVNKDPQRLAPVLFDLLRFVLQECGVKTSPEELLAQVFNAGALRAELDEIISGVKGSSAFKSLPAWMQSAVLTVLSTSRDSMPALVGIVEKRLTKWKRIQRNSAAASAGRGSSQGQKPAAKDAQVAAEGKDGASQTHSNKIDNSSLGTQTLSSLTNEGLGVSGEHIADYICAEEFGWGKDWDGHDKGAEGQWLEGKPNASKMGKLSKGGSPKSPHVLYKLTDGANGTGIDAVWRANPATNGGKKFAIIEAKASKDEDAPKFMRKVNNKRKPSITSKLGVSGIADPSELLEPREEDVTPNQPSKKKKNKSGGKLGTTPSTPQASNQAARPNKGNRILVQMSKEWIYENITKSFPRSTYQIILTSYNRHLFFSPLYHPSGSPKSHAEAKLSGQKNEHAEHAAFHYDDAEITQAVNKKKKSLVAKHGKLTTLAIE
ncbi:hypothetical protein [Pseudomonas sp.]|uniref:hypothetical protein n=1 Tax=Pseudomonas sp. TaxID=306 RepID=UPI003C788FBF